MPAYGFIEVLAIVDFRKKVCKLSFNHIIVESDLSIYGRIVEEVIFFYDGFSFFVFILPII